jgi:hypothetical protein
MITIKHVLPLLVSTLLLGACSANPGNLDSQPEHSVQTEWQTYTNAKYRFTTQFPTGWQVMELPTPEYPTVTDQVWFVYESLPMPNTGSRADVVLVFSQDDPSPSWESHYFDDYRSEDFRLGEIHARRISGVNKESMHSELVVLAAVGDFYLQALPNGSEASIKVFDQLISSLRFDQKPAPPAITQVPDSSEERAVTFEGITLAYSASLAEGASAKRIPASVDPSGFMYNDVPEHVRFDFAQPYTVREPFAGFQPVWTPWLGHQEAAGSEILPQIFIFPTREYAEISPLAGERIKALKTVLDGGALPAGVELPVLPTFNSAQDLRAQLLPLSFQGGSGLRFIARYSQGVAPAVNPAVFYTFQGLTEDGSQYVAAYFPLYVSLLPDKEEVEDWETFSANYAGYLLETTTALEQLAPAEFTPALTSLDAIIASLHVGLD